MLEKEKISSSQLCMMMILAVVASGVMWIPGITGKYAKNDLWLSPIWASIPGLVTVLITSRLHRLYPNQTVIQYSEEILGRLSGKAISFVILFFYLQITGMIVRNYADFIVANFLPRTPISFVIASMIIVCSFAVKGGVEVVGRSAQLFFPIFLSVVVFMPLLLSDMNLDYLFPVLEHGLWPSIKASLIPSGWLCEMFLMSFFLPSVHRIDKGMRAGMVSVFAIVMLLATVNFFILLVLGRQVGDYLFPVIAAFRYISVADFFENLESLVMAIWILGMFVKISVFYYATVLGTSQWLRISDYRPLVLPFGLLIGLFSFWSIPDLNTAMAFDVHTFPFYSPLIQMVLPLFLLIVGSLRKKGRAAGKETA